MRRLLLVVALLGAACGGGSTDGAPSGSPGTPRGSDGVLAFEAPKVGGGTVDGSAFAGTDVVLWFWAPW